MDLQQMQLSRAFEEVRTAGDRGAEVLVQFLEAKEGKFAMLSDGHYCGDFAVLKTVRPAVAQLAPNDIVSATVRVFKETFILLRVEKRAQCPAQLGRPEQVEAKSAVDYRDKPAHSLGAAREPREAVRTEADERRDSLIDDLWRDRRQLEHLSVADTNFTIFFRVEKKTLRSFRSALGSDKQLLSCIGFDETEKMSLTFFEPVCKLANQILEEGALYCLSNGDVAKGNKYSPSRRGLSITYSRNAKDLFRVEDKLYNAAIPQVFARDMAGVSFLQTLGHDDMVSVFGVVASTKPCLADENSTFSTVTLIDDRSQVDIRIWGDPAAQLAGLEPGKIAICQNLRVAVSQTAPAYKQLKFTGMSRFITAGIPDSLEGLAKLKLLAAGKLPDLASLAKQSSCLTKKYTPSTVAQMLAESQPGGSPGDQDPSSDSASKFFEVTAYLNDIPRDKCFYRVCPRDACKKGVTVNSDGKIECEKCGTFNLGLKANARYLGDAVFSDHTGEFRASFCDNKGDTIMGMDPNAANELLEKDELVDAKLRRLGLRFVVGVRAVVHPGFYKPTEYKIVYISEPTPEKILAEIKHMNSELRKVALARQPSGRNPQSASRNPAGPSEAGPLIRH